MAGVEHTPDVDMSSMLDVEHQVFEAVEKPGAQPRQVQLSGVPGRPRAGMPGHVVQRSLERVDEPESGVDVGLESAQYQSTVSSMSRLARSRRTTRGWSAIRGVAGAVAQRVDERRVRLGCWLGLGAG